MEVSINTNAMKVNYEQKPCYDIVFSKDFNLLNDEIQQLNISNKRICIVTESNVGPLYANEVKDIFMSNSKEVIIEVAKKYRELTGRGFELFEEYKTEDADYIMLIMGSAAGTAKQAVDELREQGMKAGVLKLRVFRPFPADESAQALKNCRAVAIMDRCESYNGNGGPLASEVPAALFRNKVMIEAVNYVYGLAGRDFTIRDVKGIFAELENMMENGESVANNQYIRLR